MAVGDYDIALQKYRAALVLDPDNDTIRLKIRRAYSARATERKILQ